MMIFRYKRCWPLFFLFWSTTFKLKLLLLERFSLISASLCFCFKYIFCTFRCYLKGAQEDLGILLIILIVLLKPVNEYSPITLSLYLSRPPMFSLTCRSKFNTADNASCRSRWCTDLQFLCWVWSLIIGIGEKEAARPPAVYYIKNQRKPGQIVIHCLIERTKEGYLGTYGRCNVYWKEFCHLGM